MKKRLIENRYECLRKIGEGGMASVFEAQDKKLNRRVAVKILHEHMQNSGDLRQRFIKEAHAVSKLRHANILEIYDFSGESSPELWVVTELIDGVDLSRYLRDFEDRRIHPIIATCIVREISIALHESHSHGIIHRDIKPSNIMITKSGRIKLMDFGIAKDMATGDMTQTGTFMGSPSYMSPEQIRGITVTSSSDLYSLCVLFYELVTGRVPFKGNHAAEIITKIIEDDPIPPKEFCPQILPTINEFILKGLEKKTSSRFLNAIDVEEKLEQILKAAGFGDSRVEIEQLFRQPKTYQEKLIRLSEASPTLSTEEKTTEPKKVDAPRVIQTKPVPTPTVVPPPEPTKNPNQFKRVPGSPSFPSTRKVESSDNNGLTLVLIGILIGLGIIFFWVYLGKTSPSGQVNPIETKSNRPPREATSRPPANEPPSVSSSESPSNVSPNSTGDQGKNSISTVPTDPKLLPKNTDLDRDNSQKPKASDPQKSSPPIKNKGNDGGRVKPLPSEVKNVEIRKNEPYKAGGKKTVAKKGPIRQNNSPDNNPSTAQGSATNSSPNQKNLEKGTLTISATGEGRLLLNNKDFGTISSQERSLPLPPGGYEVKVKKEGFKTALGMAKIEMGRTTKLLGLKLEKEKEKEQAPLYKLILTTTSSQVQIQVSSVRFKENLSLSNSKKTLTLPRGNYFVKASFKGKTIERTILLPSPYDADGTITFNAEFE